MSLIYSIKSPSTGNVCRQDLKEENDKEQREEWRAHTYIKGNKRRIDPLRKSTNCVSQ